MFNTLTFPETMEEFIEQYKVVKGENLYCDGVEFIPVFRMKEWVERLQPQKGEWIWDGDIFDLEKEYICRKCGCYALEKDGNQIRSNFCPNCGADMREGDIK